MLTLHFFCLSAKKSRIKGKTLDISEFLNTGDSMTVPVIDWAAEMENQGSMTEENTGELDCLFNSDVYVPLHVTSLSVGNHNALLTLVVSYSKNHEGSGTDHPNASTTAIRTKSSPGPKRGHRESSPQPSICSAHLQCPIYHH